MMMDHEIKNSQNCAVSSVKMSLGEKLGSIKSTPKRARFAILTLIVLLMACGHASAGTETFHLSLPNTDTGLERVLGVGVAFPHPYYQRPRYRYPVYDREGRGRGGFYGYGGDEIYPYRVFDPVEGHHRK